MNTLSAAWVTAAIMGSFLLAPSGLGGDAYCDPDGDGHCTVVSTPSNRTPTQRSSPLPTNTALPSESPTALVPSQTEGEETTPMPTDVPSITPLQPVETATPLAPTPSLPTPTAIPLPSSPPLSGSQRLADVPERLRFSPPTSPAIALGGFNLLIPDTAVAAAGGDLNGDGVADLAVSVVGATGAPAACADDGEYNDTVYIFFGREGFPDFSQPDITIFQDRTCASFGYALSIAPDIDGDGCDDLLIGDPGLSPDGRSEGFTEHGAAYVVYGGQCGLNAACDEDVECDEDVDSYRFSATQIVRQSVGDYPPPQGAAFVGPNTRSRNYAGLSIATGDLDSDGLADVTIGMPEHDGTLSNAGQGAVHFIRGQTSRFSGCYTLDSNASNLALSDIPCIPLNDESGVAWAQLNGENQGDQLGWALAYVSDLIQDEHPGLLVGAYGFDEKAGAMYILPGHAEGIWKTPGDEAFTPLSLEAASHRVVGSPGFETLGVRLAGAGDFDSKGKPDILVGSLNAEGGQPDAAVLLFGEALLPDGALSGPRSDLFIDEIPDALIFLGSHTDDGSGGQVVGLGDINGDSYSDIAISAPTSDIGGDGSGAVYLFYGHEIDRDGGGATSYSLSGAHVVITGSPGEFAGSVVAAVGDLNNQKAKHRANELVVGSMGNGACGSVDVETSTTAACFSILPMRGSPTPCPLYYTDQDGDGVGTGLGQSLESCPQPSGYSLLGGDCDDTNADLFPGSTLSCSNGVDDGCEVACETPTPVNR